jgi:hypothetical protein
MSKQADFGNIEIPEDLLPKADQRHFTVKDQHGKTVSVVVRMAFGGDLMESMKGGNKKVSPTEQFFAMMARVTSIDGKPVTVDDFRHLPLRATNKITKEFNALNGADPLEDSTDSTGEES